MTGLVSLGVRLAGGGGPRERVRAAMVALASAVGAWLMLVIFAVAAVESGPDGITSPELQRLLATVVVTIALPVVVLIATASRLSASVRNRRLAVLRLIGLSPARTRLVAAIEIGVVSAVGAVVGAALFWLTKDLVAGIHIAGRDWTRAPFQPALAVSVAVVFAFPAVSVLVSALPTRLASSRALAVTRTADSSRPNLLRLLPVAVGAVLLAYALTWPQDGGEPGTREIEIILAGGALTGLGLLLVVPVFVRGVADLSLRAAGHPALRIAARRLQLQSAGTTRVVAGLLIGLFLVSGARCVVTAFEETSQYISAERALFTEQEIRVSLPQGADVEAARNRISAVAGVKGVAGFRMLFSRCGPHAACASAVVTTCADLALAFDTVTGCDDNRAAWLSTPGYSGPPPDAPVLRLRTDSGRRGAAALTLEAPTTTIRARGERLPSMTGTLFIPAALPGLVDVTQRGQEGLTVLGEPGREQVAAVESAARQVTPKAVAYSSSFDGDYYFVAGLRALVWSIAAVILAVGLLAFGIAAIDRAVARRPEMVSLQVLGTPRRTIRLTQWLEALLPLAVGVPLATGLGLLAGSAYLSFGSTLVASPWTQVAGLAGTALLASVLVAGLTVIASSPPIRADLIRRE